MLMNHSFTVDLEATDAFDLLLDVPRIATCMPGATLTSADGDDFGGAVKVKLGPVVITYNGKARIVERDRQGLRAKIELTGRDTKGTSDASATVETLLVPGDQGTEVQLVTDLAVTGKPAQLGRGIMNDVGRKLIGQFADALARDIEATREGHTDPSDGAHLVGPSPHVSDSSARRATPTENAPIDLLEVAGLPGKKLLAIGVVIVALTVMLARRRGRA